MTTETRFIVEDFFMILGRCVVLLGRVETGVIRRGDVMVLIGGDREFPITVESIEMFKHPDLPDATPLPPDHPNKTPYGLCVKGIEKKDVRKGDIVTNVRRGS